METKLPADVIQAIQMGKKIHAIKLLREHQGLGLKEAKTKVDAYLSANPELIQKNKSTFTGLLTAIIVLVVILYVVKNFIP